MSPVILGSRPLNTPPVPERVLLAICSHVSVLRRVSAISIPAQNEIMEKPSAGCDQFHRLMLIHNEQFSI